MATTMRRPGSAQQITASAGPIDQSQQLSEDEKRRRRQQQQQAGGGVAPGQQAPWSTPNSTASTTGGATARNPFSASVYSRPTQTMQGPTVAQFSARPQQPQDQASDNPFLAQLRGIAGSSPSAPGGTGTGGMFMAPGGAGGGYGQQQAFQRFMQTIPLGGAPPSTDQGPGAGGGGGALPTAPAPPGLGSIPMTPPSGGGGIDLGGLLGSIMNQPRPPQMSQLPIPRPPTTQQQPRPPQQQAPPPPPQQQQPQQPPPQNGGITGGMNPSPAPMPPPSVFLPPAPPPQQAPLVPPSFALPGGGTDWQAQLNWYNQHQGQAAPGGGTYNNSAPQTYGGQPTQRTGYY